MWMCLHACGAKRQKEHLFFNFLHLTNVFSSALVKLKQSLTDSNYWIQGRGGGLVVGVLTFYSNKASSNPAGC